MLWLCSTERHLRYEQSLGRQTSFAIPYLVLGQLVGNVLVASQSDLDRLGQFVQDGELFLIVQTIRIGW